MIIAFCVRSKDGDLYVGEGYEKARDFAYEHGVDRRFFTRDFFEEGYIDDNGNFFTEDEAVEEAIRCKQIDSRGSWRSLREKFWEKDVVGYAREVLARKTKTPPKDDERAKLEAFKRDLERREKELGKLEKELELKLKDIAAREETSETERVKTLGELAKREKVIETCEEGLKKRAEDLTKREKEIKDRLKIFDCGMCGFTSTVKRYEKTFEEYGERCPACGDVDSLHVKDLSTYLKDLSTY